MEEQDRVRLPGIQLAVSLVGEGQFIEGFPAAKLEGILRSGNDLVLGFDCRGNAHPANHTLGAIAGSPPIKTSYKEKPKSESPSFEDDYWSPTSIVATVTVIINSSMLNPR